MQRIGDLCEFCEIVMDAEWHRPTRDHLFPRHKGYTLAHMNGHNKAVVCNTCNHEKGDSDVIAWWWWLEAKGDPRAPIVFMLIEKLWLEGVLPSVDTKTYRNAVARLEVKHQKLVD